MGRLIRREWRKLVRRPAMLWVVGLLLVFQFYAYITTGMRYEQTATALAQMANWTAEQTRQFVLAAPLQDPLKARARREPGDDRLLQPGDP